MIRRPPRSTLFPYTTLFRSRLAAAGMVAWRGEIDLNFVAPTARFRGASKVLMAHMEGHLRDRGVGRVALFSTHLARRLDRKSTRLNSSHANISYAVFCLKKQ